MNQSGKINNRTSLLKAQLHELSKTFIELDASDRPSKIYTARTDCNDGDFCFVTEYVYKDLTSSIIIKRKEDEGVWVSSTMDI